MANTDQLFDELEGVRRTYGGIIYPHRLVEFAEDPNTAWHQKFEWDNEKAGHQHRLWQARHFIKAMVDVVDTQDGGLEYKVYVNLEADGKHGGYRSVREVFADDELREQLLDQAKRDMTRWRDKYKNLQELSAVFAAVDAIA